MSVRILQGDCIDVMRTLDAESVDAVVTDPPYGLEFMGKDWDVPWKDPGINRDAGFTEVAMADGAARLPRPSYTSSTNPNCANCGGKQRGRRDGTSIVAVCVCAAPQFPNTRAVEMRAFQAWCEQWARECLRVLKPGGHILSFGGTRTYHRMVAGLEDAGFEIRDQIGWLFGSGFPKSRNLDGEWEGWGTALKPAWEPIVLARKPLVGTVARNVELHGVGALNIDGCRVDYSSADDRASATPQGRCTSKNTATGGGAAIPDVGDQHARVEFTRTLAAGRWPANVIHDGSDEVLAAFPDAPGQMADASLASNERKTQNVYGAMRRGRGGQASADSANAGVVGFQVRPGARRLDEGSAARFFYCAKTSKAERNMGLETFDSVRASDGREVVADNAYQRGATERKNSHPTVKPIALMRYLIRLVTPPGGLVLEPFGGSGSTACAAVLEGMSCIHIEKDTEEGYIAIAEARVAAAMRQRDEEAEQERLNTAQAELF